MTSHSRTAPFLANLDNIFPMRLLMYSFRDDVNSTLCPVTTMSDDDDVDDEVSVSSDTAFVVSTALSPDVDVVVALSSLDDVVADVTKVARRCCCDRGGGRCSCRVAVTTFEG